MTKLKNLVARTGNERLIILEDLPNVSHFQASSLPKLFLLDDLVDAVHAQKEMEHVFTKLSHHFGNSILYTSQNYFNARKNQTIERNLNYRIIFYSNTQRRYMQEISLHLSSDPQFLRKVFNQLEEKRKETEPLYILIDANEISPLRKYPVRSYIFPNKENKIQPIIFNTD